MHKLVRKALNIAGSQEGVREVGGPNRGPRVEEYLKSVDWGPGAPWCAAFVYWCIREAAKDEGTRTVPFVRTAGCGVIESWAKEHEIYHRTQPEPGDVFLRGTTHTGFVSAVRKNVFDTIEGNTNIGGSPEGIGVFRRTRPITRDYQYVRWGRLLQPEPDSTYALFVGGKHLADMPVRNGRALCPIRRWAEALGFKVGWDNDAQAPTFNGKRLATQTVLIDDVGYAPLRDLAEAAGLRLTVDAAARRVSVSRLALAARPAMAGRISAKRRGKAQPARLATRRAGAMPATAARPTPAKRTKRRTRKLGNAKRR